MKRQTLCGLVLSLALACHQSGQTSAFGRVLSRGGELADVRDEDKKLTIGPSTVTVWGVIEVPDGSRMQAAQAGVDAVARSELLKLIRVRVTDVMVSVDSTDPARRAAVEHTVEAVSGVVRRSGIPQHGWERVQKSDQVILRLWARLTVPKAELQRAIEATGTAGELGLPPDLLDRLAATADTP